MLLNSSFTNVELHTCQLLDPADGVRKDIFSRDDIAIPQTDPARLSHLLLIGDRYR